MSQVGWWSSRVDSIKTKVVGEKKQQQKMEMMDPPLRTFEVDN